MERVRLGERIGSGYFRDCYEVAGDASRCAKRIKLSRMLACFGTFGRFDINKMELEALRNLPAELKAHAIRNARVEKVGRFRSALVSDRVMNYDGTHAQTLGEMGRVMNAGFWGHMERLVRLMKETDSHFDLTSLNVVVKKNSADDWVPVFVDAKYIGWRGNILMRATGRAKDKAWRDADLDRRYAVLKQEYLHGRSALARATALQTA